MKIIDRPKLIRQTIFNSITVLWCSILLVLISAFFYVPEVFKAAPPALSLPIAIHSHYEPKPSEIPTISIDVKGNFFLNDEIITDISKLSSLLEDKIHEMNCKGDKVLLNIDEDTQYGKILEVFWILNKMKIKVAGLITKENAAPIDFIKATSHQEL